MTIASIKLSGFKQFETLHLTCRHNNVLVGPNNAGKSSILDALRVVNDILQHSTRRKPFLEDQEEDGVCATLRPGQSTLSIPLENVAHNYDDQPAQIAVTHTNGNQLKISLGPEVPITAYLRTPNTPPRTTKAFKREFPLDIIVVPTLGPFEADERYLADATVDSNENTRLAHRNFRNIVLRKSDHEFENLAELVAETWPLVTIEKPEVQGLPANVTMMFLEDRIPREIYWSGFGFQVWLQMLLQIKRGDNTSILVLDEPDIYLHPDLQRRLFRMVAGRFGQTFLATHSTEIINEADAGDVLSVNKNWKTAKRVSSEESYRHLFKYIGSSENAEFARLARARRIVFFEGRDKKLLRRFGNKISGISVLTDPDTVVVRAGGFEQWRRVVATDWALGNLFDINARIVALFDRDYRSEAEIKNFLSEVVSQSVCVRVLSRKELENYCLEEGALVRTVQARAADRGTNISQEEVLTLLDELLDSFKIDTQANILGAAMKYSKKNAPDIDPVTVNNEELRKLNTAWASRSEKLRLVSGKDFISCLSAKCQTLFGASITTNQLVSNMRRSEVSNELSDIFTGFEKFLATHV